MMTNGKRWVPYTFTAKRSSQSKKRRAERAQLVKGVSEDVWRTLLLRCNNTRSLVLLSGVNRALRGLIHDNHALMRYLYEKHWSWYVAAHRMINLNRTPDALHAPREPTWQPLECWRRDKASVPAEERGRFNRYVWRICVQTYAPWCSICHAETPGDRCANGWVMGLRICAACLPECFVSHRVLWREHGVWVGSLIGVPAAPKAIDDAVEKPKKKKAVVVVGNEEEAAAKKKDEKTYKPLLRILQRSVYSVIDESIPTDRKALTQSMHDLRGVPGSGRGGGSAITYLFWKAHLPRVLRLDKARAAIPVRQRGASKLSAFAARWIVQRQLYGGPRSNAIARIRNRDARKWMKEPGEYIGNMDMLPVRHAADAGQDPLWTMPMDRAWARVNDVFS